jgi:hypothetical protein
MYLPHNGILQAHVGDADEVSPGGWDCFECAHSLEKVEPVAGKVICPDCSSEFEITSEPARVTRMDVKMVKKGEEPSLRLHFRYNGMNLRL